MLLGVALRHPAIPVTENRLNLPAQVEQAHLPAQPLDMHVQGPGPNAAGVAPDGAQKVFARKALACVFAASLAVAQGVPDPRRSGYRDMGPALQKMQEQTAQIHAQYLHGQEVAQQAIHRLMLVECI